MCSPKTPTYTPVVQPQVAAPTYADASTTKATANTKKKTAMLAGRDIKTSSRGLNDDTNTTKKSLLGE